MCVLRYSNLVCLQKSAKSATACVNGTDASRRSGCRWLKYGNNLAAMRPWLLRLAEASDERTQRLFSPDIRIQTVLAVGKAAGVPPPRGDAKYPVLNAALQVRCADCQLT